MNGTLKRRIKTKRCIVYRNGKTYEEIEDTDDAIMLFIRYAQLERSETWELYKQDGSLWATFRPEVKIGGSDAT